MIPRSAWRRPSRSRSRQSAGQGPVDERLDVVTIGAGFCGLGVGAALRAHGISRFAILEQEERTGEPLRIVDGADTPGGSMGDCFS